MKKLIILSVLALITLLTSAQFRKDSLTIVNYNSTLGAVHQLYGMMGMNSQPAPMILKGQEVKTEELLSKYIQFESVSGMEREAGEWLKSVCIENGLHIFHMGNQNSNYNFAASIFPLSSNKPNIILLNHIDVAPANDSEGWDHYAYSGTIADNQVWGRGAIDNKGAAIMQLYSVIKASKYHSMENAPFNVTFLAVSCEETQCEGGVKYVVDNYFEALNPVIVIGEGPTELSQLVDLDVEQSVFGISVANKRALWLELELNIVTSGHGSVTPLSYANQQMVVALNSLLRKNQKAIYTDLNVDILKQLGGLLNGMEGFVLRHPKILRPLVVPALRKQPVMFCLFSNTITLTGMNSFSESINTIPHSVKTVLDCRLLPEQETDDFMRKLKRRLDNDSIKISVLKETPRAYAASTNSMYYEALVSAIESNFDNPQVVSICLPNFNDVGYFQEKGVVSYSVIPVHLAKEHVESIHNVNERLPVKSLVEGGEVYLSFIQNCIIEGRMQQSTQQEILISEFEEQ